MSRPAKKTRLSPGFLQICASGLLVMFQLDITTETFDPDFSATITGYVFQIAAGTVLRPINRTKVRRDPAAEAFGLKHTGL
jgi:hypothetical protein